MSCQSDSNVRKTWLPVLSFRDEEMNDKEYGQPMEGGNCIDIVLPEISPKVMQLLHTVLNVIHLRPTLDFWPLWVYKNRLVIATRYVVMCYSFCGNRHTQMPAAFYCFCSVMTELFYCFLLLQLCLTTWERRARISALWSQSLRGDTLPW